MTMRDNVFDRIREVVRDVPAGHVATYGQVAQQVVGATPRMVGFALAGLGAETDVPWHRIINASGRISLPREEGAYDEQKARLIAEGVAFTKADRIALDVYGWFVS